MTSEPGLQTIAIHILPKLSRTKVNKTMKLGQSIEYNMRNIFLEKLYAKCGRTILEDKYFSYYDLSTDQISLFGCLYFVRYLLCEILGNTCIVLAC